MEPEKEWAQRSTEEWDGHERPTLPLKKPEREGERTKRLHRNDHKSLRRFIIFLGQYAYAWRRLCMHFCEHAYAPSTMRAHIY